MKLVKIFALKKENRDLEVVIWTPFVFYIYK